MVATTTIVKDPTVTPITASGELDSWALMMCVVLFLDELTQDQGHGNGIYK
jgi:hypothetical protein